MDLLTTAVFTLAGSYIAAIPLNWWVTSTQNKRDREDNKKQEAEAWKKADDTYNRQHEADYEAKIIDARWYMAKTSKDQRAMDECVEAMEGLRRKYAGDPNIPLLCGESMSANSHTHG